MSLDADVLGRRAPSPIDGRPAWIRLGVSVVLGTIGSVGMWSVVVVLPAVQAEFGVDRADAALPYTLTMIGFALGNLVIGRQVDRFGIAGPLVIAALMLSSGFALAAVSPSLMAFTLFQGVLIGIGTSACFGPLIANISHWFERRRGIAVAAVASGNYLAGAIWPPILQLFMAADGWRTAYLFVAAVCLVGMIPLALLLRANLPPVTPRQGRVPGEAELRDDPPRRIDLPPNVLTLMLFAAGIACCVAMAMPQVHIVAYCVDLGFGVARGAEMLSLMLAAGVVSRLFSGWLADRIGGVWTLIIGSIGQCLALMFYIPFDGLASLYLVSLFFGLAQGGIVPSYAIIVREYLPAREAGARVGLVVMATVLGMALGGWISGYIFDQTGSYQAAFVNGIAWNLINVSIMLMILWRTRGPRVATA